MLRRSYGSNHAQFPENIVDPIVAGVFGALERYIGAKVSWVYIDAKVARVLERPFFKRLRDRFSKRKRPKQK